MMQAKTDRGAPLSVALGSGYVDLSQKDLEERMGTVVKAVQDGKKVVIDLIGIKGVRGDVYGTLFQRLQENYEDDSTALDAARSITLLFSSKADSAYKSYQRGYEGIFTVEFKG